LCVAVVLPLLLLLHITKTWLLFWCKGWWAEEREGEKPWRKREDKKDDREERGIRKGGKERW
jgi:hypothetical protein